MPDYTPSYVNETYVSSAKSPALDKVVFTIDHIHMGGRGFYSTYDVVRYLVRNRIPVTVFMGCTDPAHNCEIDKINAKKIYALNPYLVSFGVHALPRGYPQVAQTKNLSLISNAIREVTGRRSVVLSYHGAGAGPMRGIYFNGIRYARGVKPWIAARWLNRLDTPVMPRVSVAAAFKYTALLNKAGKTSTLFIHSVELRGSLPQRKVFDAFVRQVRARKLQAVSYYRAMELDY